MKQFSDDLFIAFSRDVAMAARDKRLETYKELEERFGLSRKQVGIYAGELGHFCEYKKWPVLNSIIVDKYTCKPTNDCPYDLAKNKTFEGEMIDCFIFWGNPKNSLTGLNKEIEAYLKSRKK